MAPPTTSQLSPTCTVTRTVWLAVAPGTLPLLGALTLNAIV